MAEIGLLHGFGASPATWRSIAPALAARHRVVSLDRPWGPAAEQLAATRSAMAEAGLRAPVLIGHSAGAELALALAVEDPDAVGALVLLAPVVGRGAPAPVRWLARRRWTRHVAPGALRFGTRFLGPALRPAYHDRSLVTPDLVAAYRGPLLEPGAAEGLWAMTADRPRASSLVADARRLRHRALVIVGDHDKWATPIDTQHSSTVVLDRCGHVPHEEHPARTAELVLAFIAELDEDRPG